MTAPFPCLDVEFCIEALEEALARFRRPDIFNTDQGSQFTSPRFTGVLHLSPQRWAGAAGTGDTAGTG
jgi:transposase InsO family protein